MNLSTPSPSRGFTLVELTVVLLIVALLISGLLLPLSAQQDIKNLSAAEKQLAEIKDALTGYAIINGRLPCPMDDTAGITIANANYGKSGADCTRDGILPWKDLGVGETDPWGQKRINDGDPYNGYWRYRVHPCFGVPITTAVRADNSVMPPAVCNFPPPPPPLPDRSPISVFVPGTVPVTLQHTTDEYPVLVVYSAGPDAVPNGRNVLTNAVTDRDYDASTRTQAFDDLVLWISRPGLFSRMASAGKLNP